VITRPFLVTVALACGAVLIGLVSGISDAPQSAIPALAATALVVTLAAALVFYRLQSQAPGLATRPASDPGPHSTPSRRLRYPAASRVLPGVAATHRRHLHALAALAIVTLALHAVPWALTNLDRIPAVLMIRPRGRDHPGLVWSFFLLAVQRGTALTAMLFAVSGGAVAGVIGGIGSGYFRLNVIERGVDAVAVFPSVLLLILFSGVTSMPGLPLVLTLGVAAFVRFSVWSQHRASALRRAEFVEYGRGIGERGAELVRRHVVRNVLRGSASRFVRLYVDMIVLAANLSFLRLVPYRTTGEAASAGLVARVVGRAVVDWGAALAGSRSFFVRQTYLPAIWPAVLLVVTVVVLRLGERRLQRIEIESGGAS
jgi:ABC-type dipeptide/oligopeptide/nickel transport system permease subunit